MKREFREQQEKLGKKVGTALGIIAIAIFLITLIICLMLSVMARTIESSNLFDLTGITDFYAPDGTFVRGKTMWDLLELLIFPALFAILGFYFTQSTKKADVQISEQKTREELLLAYLNKMTELLLEKNLRESSEVQRVGRALTLATLRRLDGKQKGTVVQFLYSSGLIYKEKPLIDLNDANLQNIELFSLELKGANLSFTDMGCASVVSCQLEGASFKGANLSEARFSDILEKSAYKWNVRGTMMSGLNYFGLGEPKSIIAPSNLSNVNFDNAILDSAGLNGVDLDGASLRGTYLKEASLIRTNLSKADLLGACLQKTVIWSTNFTEANLTKTDLSNANMNSTVFERANLSSALLDYSKGKGISFKDAIMNNASLQHVRLTDNVFMGLFIWLYAAITREKHSSLPELFTYYLSLTDFSGALLENANLFRAKIPKHVIPQAKSLEGAMLPNGKVFGTSENTNAKTYH